MDKLINDITIANIAYSKGLPILTDTEYDILWQELFNLDPSNPILYHTTYDPSAGTNYRRHLTQIYGTQKAFHIDDMKPFLQRFGSQKLIIEPKYDGVAAMFYKTRHGLDLILHGDGLSGQDISHHIGHITFSNITSVKTSVELIIPNKHWNPSFGANPRNTVAGWINRKTPTYPKDTISAIPHKSHHSSHKYITPPYDLSNLDDLFLSLYNEWRKVYPMDGLMIKVADENMQLIASHNTTFNLWSIAWKPKISVKDTTVTDITWNVSRLGKVIPIVEYTPIELCGTTNTKVTGNNAQWIIDKVIHLDATITVGKAGEIIPKIISVSNNTSTLLTIPELCPECTSPLSWENKHLICTSPHCMAQWVKKIAYFYSDKGIEIKSFGESMIYDLLQHPLLKAKLISSPWILLNPGKYITMITDIWGVKMTERYIDNSTNAKLQVNPAHFIAALGYHNLGYRNAVKCFQIFKGHKIKGHIPIKGMKNFPLAYHTYFNAIKWELKYFKFLPLPTLPDKYYCITGELSIPRNDMIQLLTSINWQFVSQVSRYTDYLILGDIIQATIKSTKAHNLNISVIKEQDIYNLIKEKNHDNGQAETDSSH